MSYQLRSPMTDSIQSSIIDFFDSAKSQLPPVDFDSVNPTLDG